MALQSGWKYCYESFAKSIVFNQRRLLRKHIPACIPDGRFDGVNVDKWFTDHWAWQLILNCVILCRHILCILINVTLLYFFPLLKRKTRMLASFINGSYILSSCYFCLVFVMLSCASVYWCLVVNMLEKGWPLGSRLWCLIVSLLLSHCYPGSDVVLDCIDSWSLPSFLL